MASFREPPVPENRGGNATDDDAIRSTNDDAAVSKLAAVSQNYLQDSFARYFVRRPLRRPPVINRGTYTRTKAIDTLVYQFLKTGDGTAANKQIVSLGAGSDTRWFLLKQAGIQPSLYFEIDFPEIAGKKAQTIKRNKELVEVLGEHQLAAGGTEIHAESYKLLTGDLRNFETQIMPRLLSLGLEKERPTLYLSECVLIYLPPTHANDILRTTAAATPNALFVTYEQIHPETPFGRTMLANLAQRHLSLPGIHAYPDLESQRRRYVEAGWEGGEAVDLNEFWIQLDEEERKRVERCEFLDEVEEWRLFGAQYCVSWGWKGSLKGIGLEKSVITSRTQH